MKIRSFLFVVCSALVHCLPILAMELGAGSSRENVSSMLKLQERDLPVMIPTAQLNTEIINQHSGEILSVLLEAQKPETIKENLLLLIKKVGCWPKRRVHRLLKQ